MMIKVNRKSAEVAETIIFPAATSNHNSVTAATWR